MLAQFGAAFISGDGVFKLLLAGFQAADDLLQLGQGVLERHRRDVFRGGVGYGRFGRGRIGNGRADTGHVRRTSVQG